MPAYLTFSTVLKFLLPLSLLVVASLSLALSTGSIELSLQSIWLAVSQQSDGLTKTLIMELRLPRALAAFTVGGMLALAGALMQVLLRNPLADPYILGISGGAAVGFMGFMLLGLSGFWLTQGAFMGALISVFIVFGLAHGRGAWSTERLLLTGVIIAAGWGALISFILAVSPDTQTRSMLFWLMGDLSQASLPISGILILFTAALVTLPLAKNLNLLARGELQAQALGVAVRPLRITIYLIASLLTASAVTIAGSIGFIGLVIPHLLRMMGARDHRILLPSSILLGGSLLVLADTLARTIIAPQQLPTGVITAMIGVPIFLYLLQRRYGGPRP